MKTSTPSIFPSFPISAQVGPRHQQGPKDFQRASGVGFGKSEETLASSTGYGFWRKKKTHTHKKKKQDNSKKLCAFIVFRSVSFCFTKTK